MYAIIKLGGHQHRIEKDMVFLTEITGQQAGAEFTTEEVLLVGGNGDTKVGKPYVSGAKVKLKVLENIRGKKIHGYIYKKRTGYQKTWGHRQNLHRLQVVEISA